MTREEANIRVIKYLHTLTDWGKAPYKIQRDSYDDRIVEISVVQEYARRLNMYPDCDPKDILLCFRQELITQVELVGYKKAKLYFDADCGLARMGYFTDIDRNDSAKYHH